MRFFAMYDSLPSKIAAGSLNCQSCSAQSGFHIETARFRLIQQAIEIIRFQQFQ